MVRQSDELLQEFREQMQGNAQERVRLLEQQNAFDRAAQERREARDKNRREEDRHREALREARRIEKEEERKEARKVTNALLRSLSGPAHAQADDKSPALACAQNGKLQRMLNSSGGQLSIFLTKLLANAKAPTVIELLGDEDIATMEDFAVLTVEMLKEILPVQHDGKKFRTQGLLNKLYGAALFLANALE